MRENKMNVLNNFFTRNTFHCCFQNGTADFYEAVIQRYIKESKGKSNAELIAEIYSVMKREYRNEYYYKNTLLNKLLLGIHSISTTTALSELTIDKSKADFVLINGKAVVYEIKTELDNFNRLISQVENYYKAFDHVAVVTCREKISELSDIIAKTGLPIGIYVLQKNASIKTVCKPQRFDDLIDSGIMFKVLRKSEYENILLSQYGSLPVVSDFKYYSICKDLFEKIPKKKAYELLLLQLKNRIKVMRTNFDNMPYELKFLAYFMQMKNSEYSRAMTFLNSCYRGG